MPVCDACGSDIDAELPFRCNHCSGTFCADCQLPENHRCPGLAVTDTRARDFRSLLPSLASVLGDDQDDLEDESAGSEEASTTEATDEKQRRTAETRSESTKERSRPEYGGAKYKPSAPSPDVNPDGSVAGEPTRRSSRDTGAIVVSVLLAPIRFLQSIPGYLRRFNRWLARLFGATWGLAKTVTPALLIMLGVLFVAGLVGTGVPMIDETAEGVATGAGDYWSETASADSRLNETEVQTYLIAELNEERTSRGLEPVSGWEPLREMGDSHASNMRDYGYVGHEQPDGTTIRDRYEARGLLSECQLPAPDGGYYPGAENAAGAHLNQPVKHSADSPTYSIDSERELAEYLVDAWMASDGHREVMLLEEADQVGLGIAVNEEGRVFAALEFC